jgi:hypothetical protein
MNIKVNEVRQITKNVFRKIVYSGILAYSSIGFVLRTFENGALGMILGSKREEITRGWRKVHDEELFPQNIRVIKSTRLHRRSM